MRMFDSISDEYPSTYNTEEVGSIINTELKQHLNDMKQLKTHLSEVTSIFKNDKKELNEDEKKDKIMEMKEYIEHALASLAYSTTYATQKVMFFFKLLK